MRKLLLFCLLGTIFVGAFLLERVFTGGDGAQPPADGRSARLVLGGGPPRRAEEPELRVVEDDAGTATAPAAAKERRKPGGAPQRRASDPPARETVRTHKVAARDTLWTIAAAQLGSGTRWKELAEWNGLDPAAPLRVGTELRLAPRESTAPAAAPDAGRTAARDATSAPRSARTHKVAKGETLSRIAARYLGDAQRWREIQRLNRIADPAAVAEGSVLEIPER